MPSSVVCRCLFRLMRRYFLGRGTQFTQEELDVVKTKFRSREATGLDEISLEAWKTTKFDDLLLVGRVFANGPGDLVSIPGRVIPKTFKMILDTSLLSTQQYKVRIKGKVEQSRERSSTLPYTLV